MPSAYTSDIAKDISFRQFVLNCARACTPLAFMREEPWGTPIPETKEIDQYYPQRIKETQELLDRISNMTPEECDEEAQKEYKASVAYEWESNKKRKDLKGKYEAMLEKVRAWDCPHSYLKDFMIKQIYQSIGHDCYISEHSKNNTHLSGEEWKERQISILTYDIERYQVGLHEEEKQVSEYNVWIRQLLDSLPEE